MGAIVEVVEKRVWINPYKSKNCLGSVSTKMVSKPITLTPTFIASCYNQQLSSSYCSILSSRLGSKE